MPLRVPHTEENPGQESSFQYNALQHVRWVYARFVQGLFWYSPVGQFHWEPNPDDSEILITGENPVDIGKANNRPVVTFTRGPIQFYSLGFDDMVGYDFRSGAKKKSVLLPGTMSINVCSRNDLESEHLAMVIADHLWLLRDLLQKEGFFDIGRNLQVGAPSPAGKLVAGEGAKEWFCTTVLSPWHINRTGQITPLNQAIVSALDLSLTQQTSPIGDSSPTTGLPQVDFGVSGTDGLPRVPHPLDPSRTVVVRQVRPYSPAVRPPSMGSSVLPNATTPVEESEPRVGITVKVKV